MTRSLRSTNTWLLALTAGGHVFLFALFFPHVWTMRNSGIGLFFDYGSRIVGGALPYRDFAAEYPPLAMALFALPRLLADTLPRYFTAFVATLLVVDLLALALLARAARDAGVAPARVLGAYTLALLAIGPIVIHQFDLVPAVAVLAALYCLPRGRHVLGGALLAAGVLLKVWPLLLVPVAALWYLRARDRRALGRALLGGVATAGVVLLPWVVGGPASLLGMARYHTGRPLQVESSYASLLLAGGTLRHAALPLEVGAGSWNLAGPGPAALASISTAVMAVLVGGALALAWRRLPPGPMRLEWLAPAALLSVLAGLLGSKVLSPQYIIWLLPMVALEAAFRPRPVGQAILALFVVIGALTHYVFPVRYEALLGGDAIAVLALLLRNVLLLALAALVAWRGWPGEGSAPTRHQEPR